MLKFKAVRAVARKFLLWTATLWLIAEAVFILEETFGVKLGLSSLIDFLVRRGGVMGFIGRALHETWPMTSLIVLTVLRQEAHRWFRIARGRRFADRLITGWFVFLGTLIVVDLLSDVKLKLPRSAIETSAWLATLLFASWCSRLAHAISRRVRHLRRIRRHVHATLQEIAVVVLSMIVRTLRMKKGIGRHGTSRSSHYRRAA